MNSPHLLAVVLCTFAATTSLTAQTYHWAPAGAATQGNSNNAFPFNRGSGTAAQIRIQHQFANSNYSSITMPIFIQKIRFRAWDTTSATWTGGTYSNAKISMSTAAFAHTAITTNFANNHGGDLTQVYPAAGTGPITIMPGTHNGTGRGPVYIEITLAVPFPYNPASGKDLLVDISHDGTTAAGMSSVQTASYSGAAAMAQGSRVWNLTDWQATTATGTGIDYSPAMEICYIPQTGLHASFTATPTSGGQNLIVTFTDTSFSSAPNGIVNRIWDFGDNSPVVSGPATTVMHTYTCGRFSPKLTVVDGVHPNSTRQVNNMIEAGIVTPEFSATPLRGTAPLTVTFTDASSAGVTAYEWDFGDGSAKSTAKNPTHVYATGGSFDVTLKVTGPCNTDTLVKSKLIAVRGAGTQCLSTIFTGGNGLTAANSGNLFDVEVKNPKGIKITELEINTRAAATTPVSIDVYVHPQTYVGNHLDQAEWVKVSTGAGTSAGGGGTSITPIDIDDIFLPPGKYGFYVVYLSGGIHYTNGNGPNQSYSNADLALTLGISMNIPWSGAPFDPRVWNGSICYVADDQAATGSYGSGCPGSNNMIPKLATSALPKLGSSGAFEVTDQPNVAAASGFLLFGVQQQWVELSVLGMPGCYLHNNPLLTFGTVAINGKTSFPYAIPNTPALAGSWILVQAASGDKTANSLGMTSSNGFAVRTGN